MVEERNGRAFTLSYYRLTVIDATGKITNDIMNDYNCKNKKSSLQNEKNVLS